MASLSLVGAIHAKLGLKKQLIVIDKLYLRKDVFFWNYARYKNFQIRELLIMNKSQISANIDEKYFIYYVKNISFYNHVKTQFRLVSLKLKTINLIEVMTINVFESRINNVTY